MSRPDGTEDSEVPAPVRVASSSPAIGQAGRRPPPQQRSEDNQRGRSPLVHVQTLHRRSLTTQAYEALRRAVAEMPVYDGHHDGHLDERALAASLGISRTPVREALLRLEHEGIIRTVPRRGVYVVRKSKEEIIEIILASAALESMAARLAATRATDSELASLRADFLPYTLAELDPDLIRPPVPDQHGTQGQRSIGANRPTGTGGPRSDVGKCPDLERSALRTTTGHGSNLVGMQIAIDEYSEMNVKFHQRIVDLAHSDVFYQEVVRLQVHMRAIRHSTMGDSGRLARSVVDHAHIVEALEFRQPEDAERYVRQHALDLAEHVRENLHHLD